MLKAETEFDVVKPHEEAVALIEGKTLVTREVFDGLLPELKARAFTVTGIEGAGVLQRVRDTIAGLPRGENWDDVKADVASQLEPFLGEGAEARATVLIRTHGFQAFQASNWRVAQEDENTTHLQYLATEDDRVRDSHLALNGIVLPKDDPFWDTHFPPWEWGCRCRVRTMDEDQVREEQASDEDKNPEDRNVIQGAVREQLEHGTLMRNGQRFDVTAPAQRKDDHPFEWNPDNLRLPIGELKLRYDKETWDGFVDWARNNFVREDVTVWNWLSAKQGAWSKEQGSLERSRLRSRAVMEQIGKTGDAASMKLGGLTMAPASGPMAHRLERTEAQARLESGSTVRSIIGTKVEFGGILKQHFDLKGDQERSRFLTSAMRTVEKPVEVWQKGLRRYYIGRFARKEASPLGMVVVTTRHGETKDAVVTFFPKSGKDLNKFREGKLLFKKS